MNKSSTFCNVRPQETIPSEIYKIVFIKGGLFG